MSTTPVVQDRVPGHPLRTVEFFLLFRKYAVFGASLVPLQEWRLRDIRESLLCGSSAQAIG